MHSVLQAFAAGFAMSLALIVAIGAQNAFVLKQGLKGEHVFAVCLFCALADAVLISLGVGGFYALIQAYPQVVSSARYAGAAFLFVYGARHFVAAWRGSSALDAQSDATATPLLKTLSILAALTFLNPHVYLDTVLLLGSVSTRYAPYTLAFGTGAVLASFSFFFALGYGAALLRPWFAKPQSWRVLDVLIGAVMWLIALQLFHGM